MTLHVIAAALLLSTAAAAFAQPATTPHAADEDAAFIDYLRRQDPASAERFIELRDARAAAQADMQRASERYAAGGPALKPVALPALQQARRRYAETSLALLDFLDTRDRGLIARLESDLERVKRSIEARAKDRPPLERMLRGD